MAAKWRGERDDIGRLDLFAKSTSPTMILIMHNASSVFKWIVARLQPSPTQLHSPYSRAWCANNVSSSRIACEFGAAHQEFLFCSVRVNVEIAEVSDASRSSNSAFEAIPPDAFQQCGGASGRQFPHSSRTVPAQSPPQYPPSPHLVFLGISWIRE